jgi:hypothetical protein
MALFDGFKPVEESALPKIVDSLLVVDANAFAERFESSITKNAKRVERGPQRQFARTLSI